MIAFAVGALAVGSRPPEQQQSALLISGFILTLLIGLRYRVGCDWYAYVQLLNQASTGIHNALRSTDPGYGFFNWISARLGLWIWGTNLACAAIFVIGLVRLARLQPNPPLAMVVAIPYLVTVVAMGYTRQSAALGLEMLSISYFLTQRYAKMTIAMFAAAAFHKSAIVILPLLGLASFGTTFLGFLFFSVITVASYFLFVENDVYSLLENYVYAEYSSSGTLLRLLMNLVPALIFITFIRSWNMAKAESRLWAIFSLGSIVAIVAFLISPSSTAVDRIALYLIPLQVLVLARVPNVVRSDGKQSMLAVSLVLIYSLTIELVWLNYADNAACWVPYQSILNKNPASPV